MGPGTCWGRRRGQQQLRDLETEALLISWASSLSPSQRLPAQQEDNAGEHCVPSLAGFDVHLESQGRGKRWWEEALARGHGPGVRGRVGLTRQESQEGEEKVGGGSGPGAAPLVQGCVGWWGSPPRRARRGREGGGLSLGGRALTV